MYMFDDDYLKPVYMEKPLIVLWTCLLYPVCIHHGTYSLEIPISTTSDLHDIFQMQFNWIDSIYNALYTFAERIMQMSFKTNLYSSLSIFRYVLNIKV